jgi:hypothetical protein
MTIHGSKLLKIVIVEDGAKMEKNVIGKKIK